MLCSLMKTPVILDNWLYYHPHLLVAPRYRHEKNSGCDDVRPALWKTQPLYNYNILEMRIILNIVDCHLLKDAKLQLSEILK